jgi:PHD/YefM family antitoxin component YafN of YafNO toxin-antitoxin module
MKRIRASEGRKALGRLIRQVVETGEPVQIAGRHGACVLVGEVDWRAIQETIYLLSIPGMGESIRAGTTTPIAHCSTNPFDEV